MINLLIGSVIGGVAALIVSRTILLRRYVSKDILAELEKQILELKLDNAGRISKAEIDQRYVSRDFFDSVQQSVETANRNLDVEKKVNEGHQATILELTSELEKRVTKDEISLKYITKDAFDAVHQSLAIANKALDAEKKVNEAHQAAKLELTSELEKRVTKEEVNLKYIAKEAFEIVNRKLSIAEGELENRDREIQELNTTITTLEQKEIHLNEKLQQFRKELEELHLRSQTEFKNLANEVLEEKKKVFIDENKKELNTILDPLKTDLTKFQEKVEATRKEDIQDITSLKKEIEQLLLLNTQLSDDAKNLATALKSDVKMQGNWGEDRLNMILEIEGLQKYIDYTREETYRDNELERNRKPDFILRLPNQKHIIIDSKVPMTAYVNYFNAPTVEEKMEFLRQHLRSVYDHVNTLSDKNYQSLAGLSTPDYVFMFMPVESALTLALNQDPELFSQAIKKKIILITPSTLVATLKIVRIIWQKENQVKNVEEIFRQCGELYNKFVSFIEEMDKIENSLQSAVKSHQDAMYHLKSGTKKGNTIIGRFEAIKRLEAKTGKQIPAKHIAENELLEDDEINDASVEILPEEPGTDNS